MSRDEYSECQDIIDLLVERKYTIDCCAENIICFVLDGNLNCFEKWLKCEQKNSQKQSRREIFIAIISTTIGAIIGLIPYFISLFNEFI